MVLKFILINDLCKRMTLTQGEAEILEELITMYDSQTPMQDEHYQIMMTRFASQAARLIASLHEGQRKNNDKRL